jgi:hypothetical protein
MPEVEGIDWRWLNEEKLYKVYRDGRIFSIVSNRFIKSFYSKLSDHTSCFVRINLKRYTFALHHVLYKLFNNLDIHEKFDKKYCIKFIDGNSHNIHIDNLKYELQNKIDNSHHNFDKSIWQYITNTDNSYIISIYGKIKSLKTNKILNTQIKNSKHYYYETVGISIGFKKTAVFLVHKLVYCVFNNIDYKSLGKEIIDHIDKNKTNNCLSNLRKVNKSINAKNINKKPKHLINSGKNIISKSNYFIRLTNYKNYVIDNYEINEYGQIRNLTTKNFLVEQ